MLHREIFRLPDRMNSCRALRRSRLNSLECTTRWQRAVGDSASGNSVAQASCVSEGIPSGFIRRGNPCIVANHAAGVNTATQFYSGKRDFYRYTIWVSGKNVIPYCPSHGNNFSRSASFGSLIVSVIVRRPGQTPFFYYFFEF